MWMSVGERRRQGGSNLGARGVGSAVMGRSRSQSLGTLCAVVGCATCMRHAMAAMRGRRYMTAYMVDVRAGHLTRLDRTVVQSGRWYVDD